MVRSDADLGARLRSGAVEAALAVITVALLFAACGVRPVNAGEAPLVALSEVDPSIRQDIRYAGPHNFTGARVPGYEAAECWLRPAVAKALSRVQASLAAEEPGLSLKVFDCYRPRRAVAAFMAWADTSAGGAAARAYHPNVARHALVPRGYIGRASSHSKGIAVDLTLVRVKAGEGGGQGAGRKGEGKVADVACTRTSDKAADPQSLDMGTSFDCFDARSHTDAPGLEVEQRRARQMLRQAMERQGFANYPKEWWHFTFSAADDGRSFDVPVRASVKR